MRIDILTLLLLIYVLYLIFYLSFIVKKGAETRFTKTVSSLGCLKNKKRKWFNLFTGLYSLGSLILVFKLMNLGLTDPILTLVCFSMTLTCVGTLLVSLVPSEYYILHKIVGVVVFSSCVLTGLVFIPFFYMYFKSLPMLLISALIVAGVVYMTLELDKKLTPKPKIEWFVFVNTILWNLMFTSSLLFV